MKLNKAKLTKATLGTGVVATPTGLYIDQLYKNQDVVLTLEQRMRDLQDLEKSQSDLQTTALTLEKKVNDSAVSIMNKDRLISQLNMEALQASIQNERLNKVLAELEEQLETSINLYQDATLNNQQLRKEINELLEQIRDLLKDRYQFQKGQSGNPVTRKKDCWVSRTQDKEDADGYGLNCPTQKGITPSGQEVEGLLVYGANKTKHPRLYKEFQSKFKIFGDKQA